MIQAGEHQNFGKKIMGKRLNSNQSDPVLGFINFSISSSGTNPDLPLLQNGSK
jgi:hypothetical protein